MSVHSPYFSPLTSAIYIALKSQTTLLFDGFLHFFDLRVDRFLEAGMSFSSP